MSGYSADTAVGRIIAAEKDTVWTPRTPRVDTCGVIAFPGQSNPTMYADGGPQYAASQLIAEIASAGIPVVSGQFYNNSWAKDAVMDPAIPAARALLAEKFPGLRTDKVIVFGVSMGCSAVARYSELNPGEVAAAVGLIPAFDPKAIYEYGDAGDAAMELAWGFDGIDEFPDALDLGPKAADMNSVPLLSAYSTDDPLIPADSITNFHVLAGGEPDNLINLGAVGHTIGTIDPNTIIRFLTANGA